MLKFAAVLAATVLSAGAAWAGPQVAEVGAVLSAALSGPVSVALLGSALVGAGLAMRR